MAYRPTRPSWPRRLLRWTLLALALYAAGATGWAWVLMTRVLTAAPPAAAMLAVAPGPDPLTIGFRGDPQTALGLPFEPVEVETDLGPAPAWLIPGAPERGDGRTAAVFLHGIAGAREDGYAFVGELHRAGVPVLLMTYRNGAQAPRDPTGLHAFGLTEWRDLEAAVALVQARGAARVILVGAAMGGAIAGQFLARSPAAAAVAGVALDAPALDFRAVLRARLAGAGLPGAGAVVHLALPAFAATHGLDLRAARVTGTVAAFPGPLVLLHGAGDAVVPVGTSDALLAARRGATFHVRSDAGHLGTWAERPAAAAGAMRALLLDLGLPPGPA